MTELNLQEMDRISSGAASDSNATNVPLSVIRIKAQQFKQSGKSFDETVVLVIKYFSLPATMYNEIRSYIASIWSQI